MKINYYDMYFFKLGQSISTSKKKRHGIHGPSILGNTSHILCIYSDKLIILLPAEVVLRSQSDYAREYIFI